MPSMLILAALLILWLPNQAQAQTISIVRESEDSEGLLVESTMKTLLREEGYTVKTATNEGIVLLLSVAQPKNRQGTILGYVGHVTIVSIQWPQFADLFIGEECKDKQKASRDVADLVGSRMTYIDQQMAVSANYTDLANMLVTSITPKIRKSFATMQTFMQKLEAYSQEQEQMSVTNPMR